MKRLVFISIAMIVAAVSASGQPRLSKDNIDEVVLRGTQKNKGTAEARQVAMYLIRKLTNLSLPDIGKEFAKDHSTVLYNIRKVELALKNEDTALQNNLRDITANINSCL